MIEITEKQHAFLLAAIAWEEERLKPYHAAIEADRERRLAVAERRDEAYQAMLDEQQEQDKS